MDRNEIREVLEQHKLWMTGKGGKKANLCEANLCDANLCDANLCDANLCGASLRYANLCGASLRYANLRGADLRDASLCYAKLCDAELFDADLRGANLRYANLCGADLRDANLCGANLRDASLCYAKLCDAELFDADLRGANLHYANLCGADLRDANLCGANLRDAKLDNVKYDCHTSFLALQCPEEGSFIGYKKASEYIVKLEILPEAKRSSATTRKCRCSAAKVLSITTFDGKDDGTQSVSSDKKSDFVYRVGEIVRVDDFDENRWSECSTGIHFFITRDEAVKYN